MDGPGNSPQYLGDRLFAGLQHMLPKYLLTGAARGIARIRVGWLKNFLIESFVRLYDVDLTDVARRVPQEFESFNDFFTRELRPGARPLDDDADSIVSPVDGTVSAAGRLDGSTLLQAKGINYALSDLLATDSDDWATYADGSFVTIYLAPYNYHRVHAPVAGRLAALRYVPGNLFSVSEGTVRALPGLFVRNERLVCHLDTAAGPMVLVFVGAMNVGTIHTIWTGDIRPRGAGVVEQIALRRDAPVEFRRGDLLGWFNMGSTVILIAPPAATEGFAGNPAGCRLRAGARIGNLRS